MSNGLSLAPGESDNKKYTAEQLYTYLIFADNYVKSKNISESEFNPNDPSDNILNTDDVNDMYTLVALGLAEHHDKGYSTGYSRNVVSKPNSNGSIDYGLWQINDFWEERLGQRFPELFDNGKDWEQNINNTFANAVAAIYIGGYVEGDGPNGGENWSTYSMVKDGSDFKEDAIAGVEASRKKGGNLMQLQDFKYADTTNKILDTAYAEPVRQSMEQDFANFAELQQDVLQNLIDKGESKNNVGYNKMKLRQMIEGM